MKIKINSIFVKVKTFFWELTIVTAGVLIALIISNFKEDSQARDYYNASVETVKNEVQANYSGLKNSIEKQTELLDTINKYSADKIIISDLIRKGGGLRSASLGNSGFEFYKKNQINSINFKMMSSLIKMESLSKFIDAKTEKLIDYVYPNAFVDSKESKKLVVLYMKNLLQSEMQLKQEYEEFIGKYVKDKNDRE